MSQGNYNRYVSYRKKQFVLGRFSIALVSSAWAERTCESTRLSVRFGAREHAMEVEIFSGHGMEVVVLYACVFLRIVLQVRSARVGETDVMENRL